MTLFLLVAAHVIARVHQQTVVIVIVVVVAVVINVVSGGAVYAALEASLLNGVVVAVTDSACLCQWQNISLHVIRASQI